MMIPFETWLAVVQQNRQIDTGLKPATDGAALVMIGLIFFLLGCFLVGGFVLYRRAKAAQSRESELLEELSDPKNGVDKAEPKSADEPWEKPADWWK